MRLLLMLLASGVLTAFVVWIRRKYHGTPPIAWSVANLVAAIAIGAVTVIPFVLAVTRRGGGSVLDAAFALSLGLVVLCPPVILASIDCTHLLSSWLTAGLYRSSLIDPPPSTFGRANACAQRNDVPGALKEFRNYYAENPKSPAPLFAAARLLESHQLYRAAVQYYQEIADRFGEQDHIWAEALLRMADVHSHYLDDRKAADALLRQIIQRARHLEQAKAAHQRLVP